MIAAQVAIILLSAITASAKIGPDTIISCAKGSSQGRMYPDPDDCRKFIRCVSRKPVSFTCPPNTAFDPDTQVCAWRVGKNGCGAKLAPTTWVGMIDNLINDISQKDGVAEKSSIRTQKRFDHNNVPKHSQKYMKLEKSSRDLVEETQQAISTHTKDIPTQQPSKLKAADQKNEIIPPHKTKMASSGLRDKAIISKGNYGSYGGRKTNNVSSYAQEPAMKSKFERTSAMYRSASNSTGRATLSQTFNASQINYTRTSTDNEASTVKNSIRSNDISNKRGNKSFGKSLRAMSAPAVRMMPLTKDAVNAEAYKSTVKKDNLNRDNGAVKEISSSSINVTSNSALVTRLTDTSVNSSEVFATNNKSTRNNVSENLYTTFNTTEHRNISGSNYTLSNVSKVFSSLNRTTGTITNTTASKIITTLNTTKNEKAPIMERNSITRVKLTEADADLPTTKSYASETPTSHLKQRNAKQKSFRGAMMRPTQITMYVPQAAKSKKYVSSPRVEFFPVPQPYRSAVETRSSKYSKHQDDLVSTTDATEDQMTNGTTTVEDAEKPGGTRAATPMGMDESKLAALKDILKYMTGKIVDRETFQVKEDSPKPKRWYDNNKESGKKVENTKDNKGDNESNTNRSSADDNIVDQYLESEELLLQNEELEIDYNHATRLNKTQESVNMSEVILSTATETVDSTNSSAVLVSILNTKPAINATADLLTNISTVPSINNTDISSADTNTESKNVEERLRFMSSPYMVKGLTRDFKCPKPDGHFVDPKDCTVYFHCEAGVAYRRDCMTGQVFLPEAASCVSANLAPPCIQAFSNKVTMDKDFADSVCEDPNGLYRDNFSCAHYFECTNGWPIRRKCMAGTVFDEARGRCTWSRFVPGCEKELTGEVEKTIASMKEMFDCPRDGYFRDPKECSVYFLCTGGEARRMTCDHGTSFDVNLNMCVWTYLVEGCESRDNNLVVSEERGDNFVTSRISGELQTNEFECPEENGVFPDPDDCEVYYTCIDDVAKRMQCPEGTGYDDISSLCIDSRQVARCQKSKQTEETRSSNLVMQPFYCPKHHGLYADPHNCTRFIHCFNNTAYRHDCMPGTAFSSEKGLCTWRHLVPDCNEGIKMVVPKTTSAPTRSTTTRSSRATSPTTSSTTSTSMPNRPTAASPTPALLILAKTETKVARNALAQSEPQTLVPSEPYQASQNDVSSTAGIQEFQCPSVLDGFYRDNLFCDIFHRCVLGTRFTFTCPTGTFFRMEGNLCDFWETVSDCTQDGIRLEAINSLPEVAPEPSPMPVPSQTQPVHSEVEVDMVNIDSDPTPCPASSGLFAHPRNCKQFLFCAHHVPLVLTCPETLLYNSQTLTCDFAKNVQCIRYDHYSK